MCQFQTREILKIKPQLDAANVQLIVVSTGDVGAARSFVEHMPWPGRIYLDPLAVTYKGLACVRLTKWQAVKRWFLSWQVLSFFRSKSSEFDHSNMEGDGLQTGAILLIKQSKVEQQQQQKTEGSLSSSQKTTTKRTSPEIAYSFYEQDVSATEWSDVADILLALPTICPTGNCP